MHTYNWIWPRARMLADGDSTCINGSELYLGIVLVKRVSMFHSIPRYNAFFIRVKSTES